MLPSYSSISALFIHLFSSALVNVQAFGIFAALVIFTDYVLVMSLFCTAVVIYHNKFEKGACCCAPSCCYGGFCATSDPSPTEKAREHVISLNGETPQADKISTFFRTKIAVFLTKRMNRLILGLLFLTWIIVAGIVGSRIEPTTEAEEFLDEDHPLQKTFTIIGENFPSTDQDLGSLIYYAWGVGEVDREGVNQLLDPEYSGAPTFIETFDFNEQCQTKMISACDDFKTNDDYIDNIKQKTGVGVVNCFVEEFAAYSVYGNLNDCQSVKKGVWRNETWQVPSESVADLMEGFLKEKSCYSDRNEDVMLHYRNDIGWDGSSLKYAAISMESAVVDPFSTLAEQTTRNEYDKFISIGENLDEEMKDACGSKVLMTVSDPVLSEL